MLHNSNLRDRDRAFTTDLVYGTVHTQRRLDDLVTHAAKRPLHRLDPPVHAALRLGAYQLLHDVPRHAAVSETVDTLPARSPPARGFADAVFRTLTRLGPPWPEPSTDTVALWYPDWIAERLARDLGDDDTRAALVAMNRPAAMTLRPNQREATADALEAELQLGGRRRRAKCARSRCAHRPGSRRPGDAACRTRRPRHAAGPSESGAGRCARSPRRRPHRRRRRRTGRQGHGNRRAPSAPMASSTLLTSTAVACGSSPRHRHASASTWCTRSSPTGARCRSRPNASIACCSTPRAAAWACSGDAPTRAGASTSRRSGSWRRCNATCSPPRPCSFDRVVSSCTRCAPSPAPRPSTSTSGPSSTSQGFDALAPPGVPWRPFRSSPRSCSRKRPAPTGCTYSCSSAASKRRVK